MWKPYSVGGSSRLGRWVGRSKGYAIQLSLAKQATQQRHEGGANEGDTAAGHELCYPQFVGTGPFFQVSCGGFIPSKSMGSFLIRCNSNHSRRRCVKSYSVFEFTR